MFLEERSGTISIGLILEIKKNLACIDDLPKKHIFIINTNQFTSSLILRLLTGPIIKKASRF